MWALRVAFCDCLDDDLRFCARPTRYDHFGGGQTVDCSACQSTHSAGLITSRVVDPATAKRRHAAADAMAAGESFGIGGFVRLPNGEEVWFSEFFNAFGSVGRLGFLFPCV